MRSRQLEKTLSARLGKDKNAENKHARKILNVAKYTKRDQEP